MSVILGTFGTLYFPSFMVSTIEFLLTFAGDLHVALQANTILFTIFVSAVGVLLVAWPTFNLQLLVSPTGSLFDTLSFHGNK